MNEITFKKVPGAEDSDKTVFMNGEEIGRVSKGWLRNGGNQWVYRGKFAGFAGLYIGTKTLKDLCHQIKYWAAH